MDKEEWCQVKLPETNFETTEYTFALNVPSFFEF